MDFGKFEKEATENISRAKTIEELEGLRIKYLGRKSELVLFLRSLKDKPKEELVKFGKLANDLRKKIELEIHKKEDELKLKEVEEKIKKEKVDITAPGKKILLGNLHPLTLVFQEIRKIFGEIGFSVVEGPEVETEWYDFDALNFPPDHPARDMFNSFWISKNENPKESLHLRTQTSPMQVRFMEKHQPPFRIIVPGRVFRYEASDLTHDIQFHQVEGLMVDKDISLANLKGVLEYFFKKFFKKEIALKFTQSYFPFVEPGIEVSIKLPAQGSEFQAKWLEVAGAGMVQQNVFKAAGYLKNEWQGFAFGMGVERLAMIKYKIDDIRLFYEGDLRFLKQF